ncbi:MAG: hypothetical protein JSR59_09280 [Proteobacteria bacterium]|nr:hypothetical protein [Pseudomonadota bacterium]
MSIAVEMSELASVMARYRYAYLMTTAIKGAPHAVAVVPTLEGGELVVASVGRRTREYATAHPEVGFVWPPASPSEYSLIVDGRAVVAGAGLRITPTRAVLHRPVEPGQPVAAGACGADCVEVNLSPGG